MTLGEKQRKFVQMFSELMTWAYANGYEFTFGEAYRTPEQAAINASKGIGIAKSLHTQRLAVDMNLFINGVYQPTTEAYKPIGEKWEAMGGSWGGRFSKPDGNHFSLEHEGTK